MTKEDEIYRAVREIIVSKTGLAEEQIGFDSDFRKDLQIRSVVLLSVVLAIELEFDIEIADDEVVGIATVGDAVRFLAGKLQSATSQGSS